MITSTGAVLICLASRAYGQKQEGNLVQQNNMFSFSTNINNDNNDNTLDLYGTFLNT